MWKKIAVAGAVGAAVLGTGAAALAETGSSDSDVSPAALTASVSATGSATAVGNSGALKGKLAVALKRFEHGSWVTTGKTGTVTHDAIKGVVTAVSPSSISVKASDGTAETFTVTSSTAVRVKGTSGKATIAAVKINDTVLVTGTKAGSADTAAHVLDGGAK